MNGIAREFKCEGTQYEKAVPYNNTPVAYNIGDSLESSSKPRRRKVRTEEEPLDLVDLMER